MNVDDRFIKGIRENNRKTLQEIYATCSPGIVRYVQSNNGLLDDAKDVFQDALLVVYRKIHANELVLTASFEAYLFSVSRFIWLKKLRKKRASEVTFDESREYVSELNIEQAYETCSKQSLFDQHFATLSDECRQILNFYFDKKSGKEIAKKMNYTLEYVKRKKYKCKQGFIKKIKQDPVYGELIAS